MSHFRNVPEVEQWQVFDSHRKIESIHLQKDQDTMARPEQSKEVTKLLSDAFQAQFGNANAFTLIDCAFQDFQKAYCVANNIRATDYDRNRVKARVYKKDFDGFINALLDQIEVSATGKEFLRAIAGRCSVKLHFDVHKTPPPVSNHSISSDSTSSTSSDTQSDSESYSESDTNEHEVTEELTDLGFLVFDRKSNARLTWDSLAGYERVKRQIADTVVNVMKYPDVYERVMKATRMVPEPNRPKAVLFEGPPGTGKTLTARILASQCDRPLVVVALENIMTMWFGEAEKKLAEVFDQCAKYTNGAIIFIDEIDALAPSRDRKSGSCGVSERILSVLLQKIEGFSGKGKSLLVAATNRKHDLDAALVSRFDLMIPYPLPDAATRSAVFRRYAKQFDATATTAATDVANQSVNVYDMLGSESAGFSCRAIKEVCEQAERTAAGRLVSAMMERDNSGSSKNSKSRRKLYQPTANLVDLSSAPLLSDYLECIKYHRDSLN